jgi:hypothetical protein
MVVRKRAAGMLSKNSAYLLAEILYTFMNGARAIGFQINEIGCLGGMIANFKTTIRFTIYTTKKAV